MKKEYIITPQFAADMARAASIVKLSSGMVNNCTYLIMQEAMDRMRKHPRYRQAVKQAYKHAMDEWSRYERGLTDPLTIRFFSVDDMDEQTRKKYGNITDRQYYEFWCGLAGESYRKTKPFITSLANKYRLSLERHGVEHADILQWPMVAMAAISISVSIWEETIDYVCEKFNSTPTLTKAIFRAFSLERVRKAWEKALYMTDTLEYDTDKAEERNIEMGLRQLSEKWADPKLMFSSAKEAVADYEEIFRTKGEWKKAQRELADARNEM